jgi:hypothetical protein
MSLKKAVCKICGNSSEQIFNKTVLFKYDVAFFRCANCGFMQTEEPYWIHEAYSSPLSATDTGLIMRPMNFSKIAEGIIMKWFDPFGTFLDYGGGNGVFVRMMRDKGFNFYRYDKYAANVYSIGFDISDVQDNITRFELLTSVEVIEHFENPLEEILKMFSLSDNILFTTFLNDNLTINELKDWWYLGEYNGQHISFYSKKCLETIANKLNCNFYTNNTDTHFFTKKKITNINFTQTYNLNYYHKIRNKLVTAIDKIYNKMSDSNKIIPQSLTEKDSEYLKRLLFGQQTDVTTKTNK